MDIDPIAEYDRVTSDLLEAAAAAALAKADLTKAKAHHDGCHGRMVALQKEMSLLQAGIRAAIKAGGGFSLPTVASAPVEPVAETTTPERGSPTGVLPSVWELLLITPMDGSISMDDLRSAFELTDAALNNRVAKAKKAGLMETAGWGRYQLTVKGKALREQRGLRLLDDAD